MGNLRIRQLTKPKRLFASNANHRHKYEEQVIVEINNLDNTGNIYSTRYYIGRKCIHCNALLIDEYTNHLQEGLPIIRLKTNHTHRIDFVDLELW